MINFLLNIITHPAFGVVTFFAGLILGNYFSIHRDRRIEFNKYAAVFRDEFVDEILEIRKAIDTRDPNKQGNFFIFNFHGENDLISHEKAKIIFEPYVSDLKGFNSAWYAYTHGGKYGAIEKDTYKHTIVLRDHLEALLKFAEPK